MDTYRKGKRDICRLRVIGERIQGYYVEDIQFMSDQIMYDTLSEGKTNNNSTVLL